MHSSSSPEPSSSTNGNGISTALRAHRCRLFRMPPNELDPGEDYVEVWDRLGAPPFEHYRELPPGQVVAEETDPSMDVMRQRMDAHWKRLGIVSCASLDIGRGVTP